MDNRVTLNVDETFLEILNSCFEQKQKAFLLLDENGIVRTDGFIAAIHNDPAGFSIELDNGRKIELGNIVAVNGIFRPEYGEC